MRRADASAGSAGSLHMRRLTALLSLLIAAGCSATPPAELGVHQEQLATCPASPNCVSSQTTDAQHRVEPLRYRGAAAPAWQALEETVKALPRSSVVARDRGSYLQVELRSALFRFVDDLEFLAVPEQHLIHLRAASRVGYWDLGVNRRRVEAIRQAFGERLAPENGAD